MSTPEQQVERLQTLLASVQKNRRQPRSLGLPPMAGLSGALPANTTGPAVSPARPAAPAFVPPIAAAAQGPGPIAPPTRPRKPTPTEPITAAVAAPPTPVREEPPVMDTPQRRPVPARPASVSLEPGTAPLNEERPLPQRAPTAPISQPRSLPPQPEAAAQQQPIVPRVIEPDPPRASTRPIAQVVSKHAPVVDATFGAMLKRSLSLRPH